MSAVVAFLTHDELVVVVEKLEGGGHLFVSQGPMTVEIVEIVHALLKKDSQGFGIGFANDEGVAVAPANVGETADVTKHFAEGFRSFPGDGKGGDSTRANPSDGATLRVLAEVIIFCQRGKKFVTEKLGVAIPQGVVFETSGLSTRLTGLSGGNHSGIDEDSDGDRHCSGVDEIVEDRCGAELAGGAHVTSAVVENHEAGRRGSIVLSRDVNPVIPFGSRIDLTLPHPFGDGALRNALLDLGFGSEFVVRGLEGQEREAEEVDAQEGNSFCRLG